MDEKYSPVNLSSQYISTYKYYSKITPKIDKVEMDVVFNISLRNLNFIYMVFFFNLAKF